MEIWMATQMVLMEYGWQNNDGNMMEIWMDGKEY